MRKFFKLFVEVGFVGIFAIVAVFCASRLGYEIQYVALPVLFVGAIIANRLVDKSILRQAPLQNPQVVASQSDWRVAQCYSVNQQPTTLMACSIVLMFSFAVASPAAAEQTTILNGLPTFEQTEARISAMNIVVKAPGRAT
jgi:hypothetical protein